MIKGFWKIQVSFGYGLGFIVRFKKQLQKDKFKM